MVLSLKNSRQEVKTEVVAFYFLKGAILAIILSFTFLNAYNVARN